MAAFARLALASLALALPAAACAAPGDDGARVPSSATGASDPVVEPGAAASTVGDLAGTGLEEREALLALGALEGPDGEAARAAIDRILAAGDRRFVAVFVELIRASEVGIASPGVAPASAHALQRLTGEDFGGSWPAWMEWLAAHDPGLPPGFVDWKGRLLRRIDPRFRGLFRERHPRRIRPEEIVWGGVAYEGIAALDRPAHVPAGAADWLEPDEPVFGVALGTEARAYPLRILDWHELVNDELGGVPFALSWCTLCGSGIAYDARVPGREEPLTFGSSGLLWRSNKLMVDRETRTLWSQLLGRPVMGPLAEHDLALEVLPGVVARWSDWRRRHPSTTVLSLDTGYDRSYEPGAAYAGYFASEGTMFPVRRVRDELPRKARVFGLERGGEARAWPLGRVLDERVLNDRLGDRAVVIVAAGPGIEVDGVDERSGPARYTVGAEIRAYRRGEQRFRPGDDPDTLLDAQGRAWRVEEEALEGPQGARLARVPGVLAYWFAWTAFHPRTTLAREAPLR